MKEKTKLAELYQAEKVLQNQKNDLPPDEKKTNNAQEREWQRNQWTKQLIKKQISEDTFIERFQKSKESDGFDAKSAQMLAGVILKNAQIHPEIVLTQLRLANLSKGAVPQNNDLTLFNSPPTEEETGNFSKDNVPR